MANVKITELVEITDPQESDVFVVVDDPAGTPATKKTTEKSLFNARKVMSIVPAATFSLGTGTSVQSAFPTTGDVITLAGSSTYEMEGYYRITKTTGACTTGMAFALGGGASVTSIDYVTIAQNAAVNTTGTASNVTAVSQVAATVVTASTADATWIKFSGLIRMNAGGTVTPQIIFSASPTSPVMTANSYIKFTRIGTNTENIIGNVS